MLDSDDADLKKFLGEQNAATQPVPAESLAPFDAKPKAPKQPRHPRAAKATAKKAPEPKGHPKCKAPVHI